LSDSTSVNLYKLAAAALNDAKPSRATIVVDTEDFPTNRYIVQGLAHARGLKVQTMRTDLDAGATMDDLTAALDENVTLVVLSMVSYRCGALLDMAAVNEADRRGGHVALEHPDAWRICQALAAKTRVVCDFRVPERIRLAPAPLYTQFVDVWDAVDRLREVMSGRQYEDFPTGRLRIT
jgi:kynureninase